MHGAFFDQLLHQASAQQIALRHHAEQPAVTVHDGEMTNRHALRE